MTSLSKYLGVLSGLGLLCLYMIGVVNLDITLGIIATVLILRAIRRR